MKRAPWNLSVSTYNVLADGYIKPGYYPLCAPDDFLPALRHPRLDERVEALGSKVICLQETDRPTHERISDRLQRSGFHGRWGCRQGGKPDGCSTFAQAPWRVTASPVITLGLFTADTTGRIALFSILRLDDVIVYVVNLHLAWHAPDAPEGLKHGLHQARELADFLEGHEQVIICGDMNAEPGSDVLSIFREAGYIDAHPNPTPTFNADGRPRKIDFMLHTPDLAARPWPTAQVAADTALPSATEPSDHVPLRADFFPKP